VGKSYGTPSIPPQYINAASELAFSATMIDQDMSPIPLPTDQADGALRAESATAKSEHTSHEKAVPSTMETSGNPAQTLDASDKTLLPAPSPPTQDEGAQWHETTEPDGYYPQTLDVSGSMARCIA
jgi:hypothetical protein